jgi:hypothetical protein
MTMYFLPRMKPGHVSGAAGASGPRRVEKLVSGSAYRGVATPKNIVPYEEPRTDDGRKARATKEKRARDVAQAYDMAKHQPNTVRERLRDARAASAELAD